MSKSEAKFLLPSPNFNKNAKDAANTTKLHYLTPSGMSLLPRTKQPPPMYGPRGATVPPKFLHPSPQQDQQGFFHSAKPNRGNEPPGDVKPPEEPPQYCETCDMELQSARDLHRHIQQHEPCPVAECQFVCHPAVLDKHIEAMHVTDLYQKVRKLSTPEEIAAWRAERRKRYPTVANVEQRERAKEQRQRRGERLEKSRNRFGNIEDRKRVRQHDFKRGRRGGPHHKQQQQQDRQQMNKRKFSQERNNAEEESTPTNKRKFSEERNNAEVEPKYKSGERKQQPQNIYPRHEQEMPEVEEISFSAVPPFKGTSGMSDYAHFKSRKPAAVNVLSSFLGMYGSDDEITDDDECKSDQEEDAVEKGSEPTKGKDEATVDQSISIADDKQEIKNVDVSLTNETDQNLDSDSLMVLEAKDNEEVSNMDVSITANENQENFEDNDSSNEAPEEAPIIRMVEPINETKATTQNQGIPKRGRPAKPMPQLRKRQSGLNYQKVRLRKQNTMLEKLLEGDIRHERNVLLQCVRFVCENNFFGIGQPKETETKTPTDSS